MGGMPQITLFLDILIVTLLIIGIIYAVVLDNHLSSTKENYRLLSRLIEQFYQAADKTQNDLIKLKNEQEKVHKDLLSETQKAIQLKNELDILSDRIEKRLISLNTGEIRGILSEPETEDLLTGTTPGDEISQSDKELLLALKEIK